MKAIERLKDSKPVPACSKRGIQRLIFQSLICNFLISHLFILPAFAVEVAPRISDREIIEKLSALDAKIDREIANVRGDIKELKAGQKALQLQIADLKESTNKRIDDTNKRIDELKEGQKVVEGRIDTLIYAVLGCFIALIGIVVWDRRTAITPAIRKNKELEEREDKIEKALKEYANKEPRLAEILRSVGIM